MSTEDESRKKSRAPIVAWAVEAVDLPRPAPGDLLEPGLLQLLSPDSLLLMFLNCMVWINSHLCKEERLQIDCLQFTDILDCFRFFSFPNG